MNSFLINLKTQKEKYSLELIKRNDIKKYYFIKIIFQLLRKFREKKIGNQYYWIACLSRDRKISLEQCFMKVNRNSLIPLN